MHDRVLRYHDRVENLYFTFMFVLRAVTKVSLHMIILINTVTDISVCIDCLLCVCLVSYIVQAANYLEHAEYNTGNLEEDLKVQSLMRQLLYNPKLQAACPLPFDEAKLWQGQSGPELKLEIQKNFRNIRFVSMLLVE